MVKHPQDTFLLQVSGDSMMEAGISENDILVVDRKLEARSGHIVVASVNGQTTVKTLRKDKKAVILVPENRAYVPIRITPESDFRIQGVVTNVIRRIA